MTRIKENIRVYKPNDPYWYKVDNLPILDLLENDIALQEQIDIASTINKIERAGFTDLLPYASETLGRVHVSPGNFISRIQNSSFRQTGDAERDYTDPEIDGVDYNNSLDSRRRGFGIGRTALVRFPKINGVDQFVTFDSWKDGDFEGDAPQGRLDLVFIRGNASFDSMSVPTLGTIKGGGLTSAFNKEANGTRWEDWQSGTVGKKGKTTGTGNEDIPANSHGREGLVLEPEFGTIPLPDDLINFAVWNADSVLSDYITNNANNGAAFGLPICYVFVPNGYRSGDKILPDWIIDIRDFFRTTELTIDERQAIMATTKKPSFSNPFVTESRGSEILTREVNRSSNKPPMQAQVDDLENQINNIVQRPIPTYCPLDPNSTNATQNSLAVTLEEGSYLCQIFFKAPNQDAKYEVSAIDGNGVIFGAVDADLFGAHAMPNKRSLRTGSHDDTQHATAAFAFKIDASNLSKDVRIRMKRVLGNNSTMSFQYALLTRLI